MNAFEKAVARIEEMKARHGEYPVDLTLIEYDRHDFALAFPGEDFVSHRKQWFDLHAWCSERGIKIIKVEFDPELMKGGAEQRGKRARAAVVPPYRLGLEIHSTAVAGMVVELSRQTDSRGFRKPVGLGIPTGKVGKD